LDKEVRGATLKNKKDFARYLQAVSIFSEPEVTEAQKISPAEVERLNRELRQKAIKDSEEKMVVDSKNFHVYTKPPISHQLDKTKGILDGPCLIKGLTLPKKLVNESPLNMTESIEPPPVSILSFEKWDGGPAAANLAAKNPNRFLRIEDAKSNMDFIRYLPNNEAKSKVYKPPHPSPFP
jgi:hypothetical protein